MAQESHSVQASDWSGGERSGMEGYSTRPITALVASRLHQISCASYLPPWRQGPVNPDFECPGF